jgi:hypothetical protein
MKSNAVPGEAWPHLGAVPQRWAKHGDIDTNVCIAVEEQPFLGPRKSREIP